MKQDLSLVVNGERRELSVDPDTPLLTVLRNELGLTGTRFGCGMGLCGACFVRMEGQVVASCDTPMWAAQGREVVTVEGLAPGDALHPVQQALIEHQAAQCGFCISGVTVNVVTLLERNPTATEDEVAAALDRNLCRCGVQRRIIAAVCQAREPS